MEKIVKLEVFQTNQQKYARMKGSPYIVVFFFIRLDIFEMVKWYAREYNNYYRKY